MQLNTHTMIKACFNHYLTHWFMWFCPKCSKGKGVFIKPTLNEKFAGFLFWNGSHLIGKSCVFCSPWSVACSNIRVVISMHVIFCPLELPFVHRSFHLYGSSMNEVQSLNSRNLCLLFIFMNNIPIETMGENTQMPRKDYNFWDGGHLDA